MRTFVVPHGSLKSSESLAVVFESNSVYHFSKQLFQYGGHAVLLGYGKTLSRAVVENQSWSKTDTRAAEYNEFTSARVSYTTPCVNSLDSIKLIESQS